ncbi:MAG TPA: M20/M25/M40 family metallo-hydrolase [Gaiellaceae bacterium]|jgi:acetylornithine deacetylase/succinyl-diaminopimelate desuccinylase-like protein|nr:M20/M25/M40 family metallo-hydrolase [Gaiellaceae bacterium]
MTETHMTGAAIQEKVRALMPELKDDLVRLSRIPSISTTTEVSAEVIEAHDLVVELLRGAGVTHVDSVSLPGTAPVIVGEIPAPEGAPTVLLYSHYDVVPAGDESLWTSPPWEPTERDGALYGRGTSDSKANIIAHIGALRAWDGKPPVGIKLVIEGQEEVGGGDLTNYARSHADAFRSDAMIIGDAGSVRPGVPTLTIGLRGMAQLKIEVSTLAGAKHSGQYGGAAPDALIVLIQALAALHDENGDVAVPGLRREEWSGTDYSDEEFRALAEINDGLPFQGTGGLGSRLWSGPAITVIGIDAPSVAGALNAVQPNAAAKLNVRVHPAQDAKEAQAAVVSFLEGLKPFGIPLKVTPLETGNGFLAEISGPAYTAAKEAMSAAWGSETAIVATGGSIPLVNALAEAVPEAEILLLGATDGYSNIHAPDERVILDELEKAAIAEAEFFQRFAEQRG